MAKKGHGHHGGAWKVAYADFVTAMMALFLVLWLVSQDQKIKDAVQRAFTHPFASMTEGTTGILPKKPEVMAAEVQASQGSFDAASMVELNMLRRAVQDLMKSLQDPSNELDKVVKLDVTSEGIRINLFDRSRKPLFGKGAADFTEYGAWIVSTLAWELSRYPSFLVEIEGHTEKTASPATAERGPWELSADRADTARRHLVANGLPAAQIRRVAGYSDTMPMADSDPADESNRRIAILLKVQNMKRS
jgi:chemotaxis protein MotB